LLVALSTRLDGGVKYRRTDLTPEGEAPEGADVSRWETTRVVEDREDHERAVKARSDARNVIVRVCARSDFGLLCPQSRESELDSAIAEARRIADEHNASSKHSRVNIYALKGRIASTDDEAIRAIASEVRGLVSTMRESFAGLTAGNLDASIKAARDAATAAKQIAGMLGENEAARVTAAVAETRTLAREIVKRAKDGEAFAKVLETVQIDALRSDRFAFLDLSEPIAVEALAPGMARVVEADTDDDDRDEVPALAFQGAFRRAVAA
jgi:hypothetical protein